ncbi:MAG: Leucyl/phenylalanyl-tRNA--protein transferase [Alphaproteobacteria bacterium ADurb.BinA280]|nr:MAG: Leucyl/phenylalanyl-tRNA--protein transferase [Alphaproteobacteria bacterium ADurb.BinA280]
MSDRLPQLGAADDAPFPAIDRALRDPNGLLCWGGHLSTARLLNAYRQGIFPWFSEDQPPLWWSPDPRMIVATNALHASRSLRKHWRRSKWTLSADRAFEAVIRACADAPRHGQRGTWISAPMRRAYIDLHRAGHAHSVEVWDGQRLIGGIYGVAIGRMFFGESMFSAETGASKSAIAALCAVLHAWGCPLLDGQVESDHLATLGFRPVARHIFSSRLRELCAGDVLSGLWSPRWPLAELQNLDAFWTAIR